MEDDIKIALGNVYSDSEGEEDLSKTDLRKLSEAVVAATDWTAETIVSQLDRGNIDLNPAYQRRDAWTPARKSKFIESLILGLPIPQLVLAENKKQKGSYVIIDGKQRLLSLRQFSAKANDPNYKALKLQNLEFKPELEGMTLEDLEKDPAHAEELRAFQNQTIRTVVIKGWPNENILYLIFLRLNTGSVQLSPQELRQALHPGPFLSFVEEQSRSVEGLKKALKLSKPDFRMRDAELLLRYIAYKNFIASYRGNLKEFLDGACEQLNRTWASVQLKLIEQIAGMEKAFEVAFQIFGENHAFRKWGNRSYEPRFNRAVFDIMMFYFSSDEFPKTVSAGLRRGIESDFKHLCETNAEFRASLETTTKSIEATGNRLHIWGETLSSRARVRLTVPALKQNLIEF